MTALDPDTTVLAGLLSDVATVALLLAKLTLILSLALIATRLMKRRSAAQRHYVWRVAIFASLVLTFANLFELPFRWSISISDRVSVIADKLMAANQVMRESTESYDDQRIAISPSSRQLTATSGAFTDRERPPVVPEKRSAPAVTRASSAHQPVVMTAAQLTIAAIELWLLVSVVLLARLMLSHWNARRLLRTATEVRSEVVACTARSLRERLGLQATPKTLQHHSISTPCVTGWRSPTVLLPVSATEWSNERTTAVLTHEFAHIARHDVLAQCVASILTALYWFHPLAWFASRELRRECERAADDVALTQMPTVRYAEHLLQLAVISGNPGNMPAAAVGMARKSQLEWRIRAMLNNSVSRTRVTVRMRVKAGVVAVLVLVPLSAVRVQTQSNKPPVENALRELMPMNFAELRNSAQHDWQKPPVILNRGKWVSVEYPVRDKATEKAVTPQSTSKSAPKSAQQSASQSMQGFDKTIPVKPTDVLTLNIVAKGQLVLHESPDSVVRVRVTSRMLQAKTLSVELDRVTNGAKLNVYARDAASSDQESRYEIWMPQRMNVFVEPTGADHVRHVRIYGIKDVASVHNVEIEGPMDSFCAAVVMSHVVAKRTNEIACGPSTMLQGQFRPVRVIVDGRERTGAVLSRPPIGDGTDPMIKGRWNALPFAQYKPDSVMIATRSDSLEFRIAGRRWSVRRNN
jgi:beta-lactamase regulating signal transducer with metallopeptidase domain